MLNLLGYLGAFVVVAGAMIPPLVIVFGADYVSIQRWYRTPRRRMIYGE